MMNTGNYEVRVVDRSIEDAEGDENIFDIPVVASNEREAIKKVLAENEDCEFLSVRCRA